MARIIHSGDGGDVIAAMLIARHLGGAHMILTQGPPPQRPFKAIAHMLIPLLRSQPYILSADWADIPIAGTHELIHWRSRFYKPTQTLAQSQADSLGIHGLDYLPWLTVSPNPRANGKVVIARTRRYNNPKFPWRLILSRFRNKMLFVGLDDERHQLERISGFKIDHFRVRDFLEMASLIAGSECLISNQTCAYWLAAAMGHPLVQETENVRRIHDAQVPRPNAVYLTDSNFPVELPKKVTFEYVPDYSI